MTAVHIPFTDAVFIPLLAALVSAVGRLCLMRDKDDMEGFWTALAFGPDLMVGAVVAIPALLVGRTLGVGETGATARSGGAVEGGNVSGDIVVILMVLFIMTLWYERMWGKDAREKDGVRVPLCVGVLPQASAGFLALGFALALGTT